jgi:hypothetical protein
VQNFLALDPELRKVLGYAACNVDVKKKKCSCEYLEDNRHLNIRNWMNYLFKTTDALDGFKDNFVFFMQEADAVRDEGQNSIKQFIGDYVRDVLNLKLNGAVDFEHHPKTQELYDMVKPLMEKTPAMAGSIFVAENNTNHEIETNSILIPDYYIHANHVGVKSWYDDVS